MQFKNFTLDRFQEEAIDSVNKNHSVMVSAPTGSGKTLIADYIIDKTLKTNKRVIYTAPIKALSNQKYKDFTIDYGSDRIGLITGDTVINPEGQVLIMTTEVYRNMAIIKDPMLKDVSYCIMDEIHYINDEERGYVWEESIIFSPTMVRFLFLSATVPNAEEFAAWVANIKNHTVDTIKHHVRPVPLDIMFYDPELGITSLEKIKDKKDIDNIPEYGNVFKGRRRPVRRVRERTPPPDFRELVSELKEKDKLPCIYFVFSRLKTQDYAQKLVKKIDFLNNAEKVKVAGLIHTEFNKLSTEVKNLKSTINLRLCLAKGVAFHHAGVLPDIKHIIEKLFSEGLIKVLFATETFAVGINMPAKTVCFDSLRKYTGSGFRYLNTKEFFQISGRAGRRGMDKTGLSVSVIHRPSADFVRIYNLTKDDTDPIMSQFKLSYNTVLNMINLHNAQEIDQLLMMNFYTFQELGPNNNLLFSIKSRYNKIVKILTKYGYIKNNHLTEIGIFTTKIFSNELEISQIFSGTLQIELDEYLILLLIAKLSYEEKKAANFYKKYPSDKVTNLVYALRNHSFLRKYTWDREIKNLTAIINPLYEQKTFTEILNNTNFLEGDLMRLFMQMLDRLEQIDRALSDYEMIAKIRNCKHLIKDRLEGLGVV